MTYGRNLQDKYMKEQGQKNQKGQQKKQGMSNSSSFSNAHHNSNHNPASYNPGHRHGHRSIHHNNANGNAPPTQQSMQTFNNNNSMRSMATSSTSNNTKSIGLQQIEYRSENSQGAVPAFISTHTSQKYAIVVIQEWWGAEERLQRLALQWFTAQNPHSQHNYTVLVPDLYRGKVTDDREEAGHLMENLDFEGAVQDIRGAVQFLKNDLGFERVGVVGFCMGGALSLASAVHVNELDAAAVFYGIPDASFAPAGKINIPLQLHFGQSDDMKGFSDPESANKLEEALQDGSVQYKMYRYDNAGHAFSNSTHHSNKDEKKASDMAQKRVVEFFDATVASQQQ